VPSVEDLLEAELRLNADQLWLESWRPVVHRQIAAELEKALDLNSGKVTSSWDLLDDPIRRAALLKPSAELQDECADLLLRELPRLNAAVQAGGQHRRGAGQMRTNLILIIPAAMKWPSSNSAIVANPFPDVWRLLADGLAQKASSAIDSMVHAKVADAVRDDFTHSELPVQMLSLLAGYFVSCKLPEARLVENDLRKLSARMSAVRGSLVRLTENVSADGVRDCPAPSSLRRNGLNLIHGYLSHLIAVTAEESRQIAGDNGFMRRILPANRNDPLKLRQGQQIIYRQYECTVLAYMALSCVEQLLRAWAAHEGVDTVTKTARPRAVLDILDELSCAPTTRAQVRELYDSTRSNIRNRIMHGGLLDVASKHQELLLHVADPVRFPLPLHFGRDEFAPENICRLCFDCLEQVDADAATRVKLTRSHLAWAADMRLEATDVTLGHQLHHDFLGPNGMDAWNRVSNYLNAVVPCVKQFFTIGFRSVLGLVRPDTIVEFMAMMLVFDALYRSTAQLYGFRILQVSAGHMQYRMLDQKQLCSEPVIDALVENIDSAHRGTVRRVLELVTKARNAFAHGAIETLDQHTSDGIGYLIVKGVQSLVDAGVHKMTSKAAYHLWQNDRGREHGFDVEDWLNGEEQVLNAVDYFAVL
jgi:hypothetical protein